MSNDLKMAKVISIQALHRQGWSQRRIARELGVDRGTVARQLRQAQEAGHVASDSPHPNAAKAPTGSDEGIDDSNAAKSR